MRRPTLYSTRRAPGDLRYFAAQFIADPTESRSRERPATTGRNGRRRSLPFMRINLNFLYF
ncbi:hypothetical protein BURCENK562V_C3962 [Burkholderia cenocepacia K56-2Valvano]|nr:hypothetical protein BURCENK562V_C3962 [Burkholderia cenocepacia K56-2Valvano]